MHPHPHDVGAIVKGFQGSGVAEGGTVASC